MATTTETFLTQLGQAGSIGEIAWDSLSSGRIDDAAFADVTLAGGGSNTLSESLNYLEPIFSPEVPVGSTIASIKITVSKGSNAVSASQFRIRDLHIVGGTTQADFTNFGTTQNELVIDETIGTWGLTNQQALDFIKGVAGRYFTFQAQENGDATVGEKPRTYWVKVQAVFTPPPNVPSSGVPVMF